MSMIIIIFKIKNNIKFIYNIQKVWSHKKSLKKLSLKLHNKIIPNNKLTPKRKTNPNPPNKIHLQTLPSKIKTNNKIGNHSAVNKITNKICNN